MSEKQNQVQFVLNVFQKEYQSLVIATKTEADLPYTSYAPFVYVNSTYYLLISKIAKHYINLEKHQTASIMMIEDEKSAQNIFFRKRLSYLVKTKFIHTTNDLENAFVEKFGGFVGRLFQMDFVIVECDIVEGTLIVGPGQAYKIDENQNVDVQMTGNTGKGHESKS